MRKLMALAFVFAIAGGVVAADKADKKAPANPEEAFKKMDKNSDGFLSKEEYVGKPKDEAMKGKKEASFGKLDKDGDGKLSMDEFKAAQKKKK